MIFSIHRYELLSSTNDFAARMAEDGAPEGTVVIADQQVAGRGRHGRHWSSPEGEGLYLSVILRPDLPFDQLWQIGFVAAAAAAQAIREVSGLTPQIKWPNDVLLNGRKVCGILVEARTEGALRPVIVGIGINVNSDRLPPEIADKATSIMRETGNPASVREVETALLEQLDALYSRYMADGFDPIFQIWQAFDCTPGRRVSVITSDAVIDGTAVEVDSNGDLIVRRDDGTTARVTAGEVILRNE